GGAEEAAVLPGHRPGGDRRFHPGRSGRADYARADLRATDVRGEWPSLRLHRRGLEDGAAIEGDGEGQLPPGARPGSGSYRGAVPCARREAYARGSEG